MAAALAAANVVPVQAQVLVELYTSQGCSSCPPADGMLTQLTRNDDVIALALHVDYWDYLGWKDEFGHSANTERQRGYARAANSKRIYTPQFIVGGSDVVVGHQPEEVAALIRAHKRRTAPIRLVLSRSGEVLRLTATPTDQSAGPAVVQVVRFRPAETVAIARGENAGRSILYSNIVTEWRQVGQWAGAGSYMTTVRVPGPDRVVVIVQRKGYGPVLAAEIAN